MVYFLRRNFGYSKNESFGVAALCMTLGFITLFAAYNSHASKKLENEAINNEEIEKLKIAQSKLEEKNKLAKSLYKKTYSKSISNNNKTSNIEIKSEEKITPQLQKTEKKEQRKINKTPIDLNTAIASDLQQIRWVGEYTAGKIVKYREKIGGFVKKEQVQAIGKISENAIKSLFEFTYINKDFKPEKRNINTASFKEFLKIPYMDYDLVKKIFNHKRKIQNFKSLEDFREIARLTTDEWMVVEAYITI